MSLQRAIETTGLIDSSSVQRRPGAHYDDAVIHATKRLIDNWITTISLWFISFVLVMLRLITDTPFLSISLLLFPMWAGSLYGIISLILITMKLCTVSRLLTEEEMESLEYHGEDFKLHDCVMYDSMLLLRLYIFIAGLSCLSLVLICTTQVSPIDDFSYEIVMNQCTGACISVDRGRDH